jgi:glycine dehydrogenase
MARLRQLDKDAVDAFPDALARTSAYLTHPTFHRYHAEHEMLRYLRAWPTRTWRWTAP